MGIPTPHFNPSGRNMETNYSSLWITLLNTVFASVAFMVWYMINVEEKQEAPKQEDIRIIAEDQEEEEENVEANNEEKHLYIQPSLRNQDNILSYTEYCAYGPSKPKREQSQELYKELYKPAPVQEKPKKTVAAPVNDVTKPGTFQWPRQDDVIESLRSMNKPSPSISDDLAKKLSDNGIMRSQASDEKRDSDVRVSEAARASGRLIPKKQVCVVWDVFQATSRPGLEHANSSPEASPSPRVRKPLKMINNGQQRDNNKSKYRFTQNLKQQNTAVRAI